MKANEFRGDKLETLNKKLNKFQYNLIEFEQYIKAEADEIKEINEQQTEHNDMLKRVFKKSLGVRYNNFLLSKEFKEVIKPTISDMIYKELKIMRNQISRAKADIEKWENKSMQEIYADPLFNSLNICNVIKMSESEREEKEKRKNQLIEDNKPNDWRSGNF